LCQILLGCAITKGTTNPNVKKAIELQQLVINNPLFEKILIELEESGNIHWGKERTKSIKEKLADHRLNSDWLISNYKKKVDLIKILFFYGGSIILFLQQRLLQNNVLTKLNLISGN
jgi:hypothetical protein